MTGWMKTQPVVTNEGDLEDKTFESSLCAKDLVNLGIRTTEKYSRLCKLKRSRQRFMK